MIYEFEQFELDLARFELRENGKPCILEPQVLALLALLIENRERLMSKEEIFEKLWRGRVVTDATLLSRIKSARQALGDSGKTQRFIKTVYGKGFIFVADVKAVTKPAMAPSLQNKQLGTASQPIPGGDQGQRPSIAVLPFQSMTDDASHEILAVGLSHELIAEIARMRWLFVIARGSSFRFKDPNIDVREVGRILGIRYCLTGEVEVRARQLAITVELADTRTGEMIWAEQYNGHIAEIHDVRKEIASRILMSLEVQIPLHEAAGARLIASSNLDAWSAYHLGLQHLYRYTKDDNAIATRLFSHAIDLDPGFARAHAGLSFVHFQTAFMHQSADVAGEISLARSCAQHGIEIDPLDPFVNFTMGRSYWLETDLETARSWLERATSLCPNYAQGIYALAWTNTLAGFGLDSREQIDHAMRLSPLDPLYYAMLGARGFTHIAREEYDEAVKWTDSAARSPGAHVLMALLAAASQVLAGNAAEAANWANSVRERDPSLTRADFQRGYPVTAEPMRTKIDTALRGLGF